MILLQVEKPKRPILQSFNLKGDWNTAWENPIFQGEVQTAVNAMFEWYLNDLDEALARKC